MMESCLTIAIPFVPVTQAVNGGRVEMDIKTPGRRMHESYRSKVSGFY